MFKIRPDKDGKGISIGIIQEGGVVLRRAFRKEETLEDGTVVINNSYSSDIDTFTGQENFLESNNIA